MTAATTVIDLPNPALVVIIGIQGSGRPRSPGGTSHRSRSYPATSSALACATTPSANPTPAQRWNT